MSATSDDSGTGLVGTASDEVPEILGQGRGDVSTLFVSMSERHPQGADAQYLRWHSLDHRPEQHRLDGIRASLRLVSTPACRAARAASSTRYDATDHVMIYFLADLDALEPFNRLSAALRNAGRVPFVLAPVERGVYTVEARCAAARLKVGADVLPWWPARGVYVLLEPGAVPTTRLVDVPGVAGLWSAHAVDTGSGAAIGRTISFCFLDDDPVATAAQLQPVLEQRWKEAGIQPFLAAPFHTVVPWEWDRYLP